MKCNVCSKKIKGDMAEIEIIQDPIIKKGSYHLKCLIEALKFAINHFYKL
jgi:hypothetical protein